MTEYQFSRPVGRCHVSGRTIAEGEEFYSALFETPGGLERRDYAIDCWEGPPPGVVCHFKTRLPRKQETRKVFVDDEVLLSFFRQLEGSADVGEPVPSDVMGKLRFRFVLALILMRKRLLRYERTIREERGEFWEMRLVRDKTLHRVFNPSLEDAEIQDLTGELSTVLAGFASSTDGALEDEGAAADAAAREPGA